MHILHLSQRNQRNKILFQYLRDKKKKRKMGAHPFHLSWIRAWSKISKKNNGCLLTNHELMLRACQAEKMPHTANIRVPGFWVVLLLIPYLTWIFYQSSFASYLFALYCINLYCFSDLSVHRINNTLWKSCIEVGKSIVRCRFQTGSYHTNINKFSSSRTDPSGSD